MSVQFHIRPAVEGDIAFILKGYSHVVRDNLMQTPLSLTADKIRADILADPPQAFIDVALCNDELAGFVIYSTVYFATFGQCLWITTMFVDPFAPKPGLSSISSRFIEHISLRQGRQVGVFASVDKENTSTQMLAKRYGAKAFEQFVIIGALPEDGQ